MLNISENSIKKNINPSDYSSLNKVESKITSKTLIKILKWCFFIMVIIAFLPWTQNVRSTGSVTTLKPSQRPQTINSIIAGRIDEWFIQEGSYVKKGDTIALISEIKDEYFDTELIDRTGNQLELKKLSAKSYEQKEAAQNQQLNALNTQQGLELQQAKVKLQQAKLKVQNDSIAFVTAKLNSLTAQNQYVRMDSLYRQGFKSLVDLEARKIKQQQTQAYEIEAENKWLNAKSELINLKLEINNISSKYDNNSAKVLSEKLTTSTDKYDAEAMINKLENQVVNYKVRQGYYHITAPQDGYITKAFISGVGETVKEGQEIVSFMPINYDLAVEVYIDPIDLPLMNLGEKVRIQFDGWPAIVFSGWPNASFGTYGGEIYAIDQFISENGKFRILVKPDPKDHPWPNKLRFGGGTTTLMLLEDVAIWYELWRKVNGFPPNFYKQSSKSKIKK